MSWLKDILEENRRVVESWPAWKKGAAMTRKENLAQRAKETTEQLLAEGVCLSNGECEITDRVILLALQQVEREVWGKVIKEMEESGNVKLNGWIQWLKEQQKELE